MGSSTSKDAVPALPSLPSFSSKSSKDLSTAPLVPSRTPVSTGPWPVPLYKYSKLLTPAETTGPTPGVILVHGMVMEKSFTDSYMGKTMSLMMTGSTAGWSSGMSWEYTLTLAEALKNAGYAVLMIGMRDDDQEVLESEFPEITGKAKELLDQFGGMMNGWPCKYYGKALLAAIDHLKYAAPKFHGVEIDASKIAIVGHSMGGAGVLYAAATDCCDKIAAVVSLNPAHMMVEGPWDRAAEIIKYGEGTPHSGEFGEGELPHLKKIKAPTLIYGSLSEYNICTVPKLACIWPCFPNVYQQVGAPVKEMYVENFKGDVMLGHMWLVGPGIATYQDGVPLKVVLSFLSRHCAKSGEPPLEKPDNAHEWVL